jgi:hypothetical protein
MKRLKLLLACVCLTVSTLASAGVVYTWRTGALSPSIYSVTGFIELSEAAAAAGHVSYTAPSCQPWPCDLADPASPILRFGFNVNNYPLSALDIDLVAGTGYDIETPSFDAEFDIVNGHLTNLSLFVNTFVSTLRIHGDTVTWFSSDTDNCYFPCEGARGQFVEVGITEPAPLALIGLAGVGAMAAARRGRRPSRATLAPGRHA